MNTITVRARIYGLDLTEEMEISHVCQHLEYCNKEYEVGAGGIVLTRNRNGEPAMCLHKINGTWCFYLE